jgi:transposase
VWITASDMRRGMQSLAFQVQEALKRDAHAGNLYVFRGRSGSLIKILGMTASACRSMPSAGAQSVHFLWPLSSAFARAKARARIERCV